MVSSLWLLFASGIYVFWSYCRSSLHRKLMQKYTAVTDIPFLGISRAEERKIKGAVVVCGGSVAGLATARVCHDHFERVIVVEPEAWLATAQGWKPERDPKKITRARVMQYQSAHVFLAYGFMALEKLFPALRAECQEADIRICPADFKIHIDGYPINIGDPNTLYKTFFSSRHGLEILLRRLLIGTGSKQYPNIEQIVGTVTGVIRSASDPTKLEGVSVRTTDGEQVIPASLVVDCSGSAQAGLKWLHRAGFGTADLYSEGSNGHPSQRLKMTYDPQLWYSTFHVTVTPEFAERLPIPGGYYDTGSIFGYISPLGRALSVIRYEGDTIQICYNSGGNSEHPRNLEELKALLKELTINRPMPQWLFQILDALHEFEASPTVNRIRLPHLSYIRYHQARNLPTNWAAIGDSAMRVNPIYGQGCSKAVVGAVVLNTILRTVDSGNSSRALPDSFSKLFFEAQAAKTDSIWEGTKTMDYGYESTIPAAGETLSAGRFLRWYSRRVNLVSAYDQKAGLIFWRNMNLLLPAVSVFSPGLVLKVLLDVLRQPYA